MRTSTKVVVATALVVASVVGLQASPASAGIVVVAGGTQISVTVTGDATVGFGCSGGKVFVAGTVTSPTVNCSALTKVTLNGDGGRQTILGGGLSTAPFTAKPLLSANTGAGADTVSETLAADQIDTGVGADRLVLYPGGVANTTLITGPDLDHVAVEASVAAEQMSASSTNTNLTLALRGPTGPSAFHTVAGAEWLELYGGPGDDILNALSVADTSSIDQIEILGRAGDDYISGSPTVPNTISGGAGTNILIGGGADDEIYSASDTDDITGGKGLNHIYDADSLRAGGRTWHGVSGGVNVWRLMDDGGDAVVRVRSTDEITARYTTSLNRPGQQLGLTNSVSNLEIYLDDLESDSEPNAVGLADVVTLPYQKQVRVYGESANPKELVDVTVASGSWTTTGTPGGVYTIKPAPSGSALYGNVVVDGPTDISVHPSWANLNQGWAHRVIRDLQFRFPGASERDTIRDQIGGGTKTRAQVVTELMDTDLYRGLDVDRVFVKFLRRTADPGGRTYWINSLRNGKTLLQFRAQLFGSSEYFAKAGGTNAAYMISAYSDVMGRAPDPSGQAYWTNKLNNGTDRGVVAREFLKSTEARRNIVKDQYLRFLDRHPATTPGGESERWVTDLASPTGEQMLIATLASSADYRARS